MIRMLLIAAAALAGCAAQPQPQFMLVPSNPETAARDQLECEVMARSGAQSYVYSNPTLSTFFGSGVVGDIGMRELYNRCLGTRGWSLARTDQIPVAAAAPAAPVTDRMTAPAGANAAADNDACIAEAHRNVKTIGIAGLDAAVEQCLVAHGWSR